MYSGYKVKTNSCVLCLRERIRSNTINYPHFGFNSRHFKEENLIHRLYVSAYILHQPNNQSTFETLKLAIFVYLTGAGHDIWANSKFIYAILFLPNKMCNLIF